MWIFYWPSSLGLNKYSIHIELSPAAPYIQRDPLTPFGLGKVDSSVRVKGISKFKKITKEWKRNTKAIRRTIINLNKKGKRQIRHLAGLFVGSKWWWSRAWEVFRSDPFPEFDNATKSMALQCWWPWMMLFFGSPRWAPWALLQICIWLIRSWIKVGHTSSKVRKLIKHTGVPLRRKKMMLVATLG